MLALSFASLIAAQLLGIVGLLRPGYELLVGMAMLVLAAVPAVIALLSF